MRLNALLAIGSLAMVFASAAAMSAEEFLGRYGNPSRQKNFKGLRPTASMRSALGSDHEMKAARAPRPMEDRKLGERRAYRSKVGTGERKNVAAKMRSAYRKTQNGPEFRSGKFYPRSEIRTFFSTYSNQISGCCDRITIEHDNYAVASLIGWYESTVLSLSAYTQNGRAYYYDPYGDGALWYDTDGDWCFGHWDDR